PPLHFALPAPPRFPPTPGQAAPNPRHDRARRARPRFLGGAPQRARDLRDPLPPRRSSRHRLRQARERQGDSGPLPALARPRRRRLRAGAWSARRSVRRGKTTSGEGRSIRKAASRGGTVGERGRKKIPRPRGAAPHEAGPAGDGPRAVVRRGTAGRSKTSGLPRRGTTAPGGRRKTFRRSAVRSSVAARRSSPPVIV